MEKQFIEDAALKLIRKIHKNLGIFLVIFLVLLSVTGILLNHTDGLNLDKRSVPAFIAARYYSEAKDLSGYQTADRYFYTLGDELYVNRKLIAWCGRLQGAVRLGDQSIVLCNSELLLLTSDDQLIETIGEVMGVPDNLDRISTLGDLLVLKGGDDIFSFDVETLELRTLLNSSPDWATSRTVPKELLLTESISWQQFILDVHSGVFLGSPGKWFSDLVAVFVIAMAISGLVMWRNPR